MIKSRPQAGHRRTMSSAQLSAHSVSSLCAGTQSGINRIVAHGALHSPALTCQDLSRKQSSFRLKKHPTGREYRFSAIAFQGCDSKDWPLIKDLPGVDRSRRLFSQNVVNIASLHINQSL